MRFSNYNHGTNSDPPVEDSDWGLYGIFSCRDILENIQKQVDRLSVDVGEAIYFYKFSNSSAFWVLQWLFCTLFLDFEGYFLSSTEVLTFFTWILYFVFSFSGTTAEENASVIIVVWYFVFLKDGWLNPYRLRTFSSGTFLRMGLKM